MVFSASNLTNLDTRIAETSCDVRTTCIPWPGMAFDTAKDNKNGKYNLIVIKGFYDYPTIKKSSTFTSCSIMKIPMDSRIGKHVFHVVISR